MLKSALDNGIFSLIRRYYFRSSDESRPPPRTVFAEVDATSPPEPEKGLKTAMAGGGGGANVIGGKDPAAGKVTENLSFPPEEKWKLFFDEYDVCKI